MLLRHGLARFLTFWSTPFEVAGARYYILYCNVAIATSGVHGARLKNSARVTQEGSWLAFQAHQTTPALTVPHCRHTDVRVYIHPVASHIDAATELLS